MEDDSEQSHLLALPKELRDLIYEFTFASSTVDITKSGFRDRNSGLLTTSRHAREDALELYYKLTTFKSPYRDAPSICRQFLSRVAPEHRRFIRNIHISDLSPSFEEAMLRFTSVTAFRLSSIRNARTFDDSVLGTVRRSVANGGLDVGGDVFKTLILAWDGERNVRVWTSRPLQEEMPHVDS